MITLPASFPPRPIPPRAAGSCSWASTYRVDRAIDAGLMPTLARLAAAGSRHRMVVATRCPGRAGRPSSRVPRSPSTG